MSKPSNGIICLDVGGTSISFGVISDNAVVGELKKKSTLNIDSVSQVLDMFEKIINKTLATAQKKTIDVNDCVIAIPGPFDYKNGVSLMKHKFAAIYGINLKELFAKDHDLNFYFLNDADSYGYGVLTRFYNNMSNRLVTVTLGTGVGAAFFKDGILENLEIWDMPYKKGIIEDYTAGRAIVIAYLAEGGKEATVKDIATYARSGDIKAVNVFKKYGEELGEALAYSVSNLKPDVIVCGGSISKANSLFRYETQKKFSELSGGNIKVEFTDDSSIPLIGAAHYVALNS